jgi:outer membrane protein TolC
MEKSKRRISVLFLVSLVCMLVAVSSGRLLASGSGVLSLEECVVLALENNPDIGVADELVKMEGNNLLASYGGLLPNFNLQFALGHQFYGPTTVAVDAQGRQIQQQGSDFENYYFSMSSSINLFDGGRSINNIRSSMRSRDAARQDLRYSKDLVTAQVIRAYYNLVRYKRLTIVAEESMEQARQNLERSEALLEVGSATRADVLKARVLHSNTKLTLVQARNAVDLARVDLATVLNIEPGREVDVDTSLVIEKIDPDITSEISYGLANRADLKSRDISLKAADADIASAKSGWIPQIGANFNYGWSDRQPPDNLNFFQNEYTWSLSAYVSYNLFDRFATSSDVGRAKANRRIAEYNLEKARLEATREIEGIVLNMREAWERMSVATETVEQAQEDVRLAEERYRVGAGTMLETIDAQVALTQAKADVIQAKCDYLIAVADLKRATGKRKELTHSGS